MVSIWESIRKLYVYSGLKSKSSHSPFERKTDVLDFTSKTEVEPQKPYRAIFLVRDLL